MNKQYWNHKLKYLFKLPKNAVIMYFRNPNEFNYFELERINPNHKIIIWGQLKKKNRYCKQAYKIRMGKIKIPFFMILNIYAIVNAFILDNMIIPNDLYLCTVYTFTSIIVVYASIIFPIRQDIKKRCHTKC